jgi:hypothetical protein
VAQLTDRGQVVFGAFGSFIAEDGAVVFQFSPFNPAGLTQSDRSVFGLSTAAPPIIGWRSRFGFWFGGLAVQPPVPPRPKGWRSRTGFWFGGMDLPPPPVPPPPPPPPPVAKQITEGWSFNLYTPLINFVAYDPGNFEMMINFKNGTELTYSGVPYNVAIRFQYGPDPDNFYLSSIKNSYPEEFVPAGSQ